MPTASCFNSTLVQLKVEESLLFNLSSYRFNSTLVQLKVRGQIMAHFGVSCFNSTLVQLKGPLRSYSLSFT